MKRILVFVGVLWCTIGCAQKVVKKSIVSNAVSYINIDVTNCYKATISTADISEIQVEAHMDGEYNNDLMLGIKEEANTLNVSTAFQPNFVNPNDKLSAHKVISISLDITIPTYKAVKVYGTHCNVVINGVYKDIDVALSNGRCEVHEVKGEASATTQDGNIIVHTKAANITAKSKYGKVFFPEIPGGDNQYTLSSVTGDIHLHKTE